MLLSNFAAGFSGGQQGVAIQQQRAALELQQQQQAQQQQAVNDALSGLLSPITNNFQAQPVQGTLSALPIQNSTGQLSSGQLSGGSQILQSINDGLKGGVQPLQSPALEPQEAPQNLSDISIQDVTQQALKVKSEVDNNILRLASLPNVSPNLLKAAQTAGQNKVNAFRSQNLAPLENATNAIQQVLLTDGVDRARRVATEVVNNSGEKNKALLFDSFGLGGSDEEFKDKVLLAANAFGLGQDIRKERVNAAGAGLVEAAKAANQADRVVTVGGQDIVQRGGRIDEASGTRANNLLTGDLRNEGTANTARSNEAVARLNRSPLTKSGKTSQQKEIEKLNSQIRKLDTIRGEITDENGKIDSSPFLKQNKAVAEIGRFLDSFGVKADVLGSRKAFDKQSKVRPKIKEFFNAYRKEITGAAAAVQELADLEKATLAFDLTPLEFENRFEGVDSAARRELRAKLDVLQNGVRIDNPSQTNASNALQVGRFTVQVQD